MDSYTVVFETGDAATISFVKCALDGAQIEYFVRNEQVQDTFGAHNPMIDSVQFLVNRADTEAATEILKDIE